MSPMVDEPPIVTIKPGYDDVARHVWEQYEADAPLRARELVELLAPFAEIEGRRLLDVGCGYAGTTAGFANAGAWAVGLEPDEAKLLLGGGRASVQQAKVRLLRGAAERLPFRDGAFDLVICNDVIEHVVSHERTIAELSRVLTSQGFLYLNAPNRLSLRFLWRDPHYQLAGIMWLPRSWAVWYVVKVRQRASEFEVGVFPIPSSLRRLMHRHGLITLNSGLEAVEQKLTHPERIRGRAKARLFALIQRGGGLPLLRAYYRLLGRFPDLHTNPVFVARKV